MAGLQHGAHVGMEAFVRRAQLQRHRHLSPAAIDGAIRLLDQPTPVWGRGEIVETEDRETAKCSG